MGKNSRFKQGKKKFANNKRPNEPSQAAQPQPQNPQNKKQKPQQQQQQTQENKKHFVCKNYDGKHGIGCKQGDKCPYTHLSGEDLLLFQQYRSCSCLCNPALVQTEPFIPVALPKQPKKQQPQQQKNKKQQEEEEVVTVIDCLSVIEISKASLLEKIPELSTCDSQQLAQNKFWLRFPLTNVGFHIYKLESKDASFAKKVFTEGIGPEDVNSIFHIEELDEHGKPLNNVELWAVLGELKHQACILRFLERKLQSDFMFLPCRNEIYSDEFKCALWAHPIKNIDEETLNEAPPLLARIEEAREQTGGIFGMDDDEEEAFSEYMRDAFFGDDDDDDDEGFYDVDDDDEDGMDQEDFIDDDGEIIDDDGDEDYEDIEDEDEEMAKMFGKRGGPSARMMEEMMMAMMMQNMTGGRGGKKGGFNPFMMGMMGDDDDDDDM